MQGPNDSMWDSAYTRMWNDVRLIAVVETYVRLYIYRIYIYIRVYDYIYMILLKVTACDGRILRCLMFS